MVENSICNVYMRRLVFSLLIVFLLLFIDRITTINKCVLVLCLCVHSKRLCLCLCVHLSISQFANERGKNEEKTDKPNTQYNTECSHIYNAQLEQFQDWVNWATDAMHRLRHSCCFVLRFDDYEKKIKCKNVKNIKMKTTNHREKCVILQMHYNRHKYIIAGQHIQLRHQQKTKIWVCISKCCLAHFFVVVVVVVAPLLLHVFYVIHLTEWACTVCVHVCVCVG